MLCTIVIVTHSMQQAVQLFHPARRADRVQAAGLAAAAFHGGQHRLADDALRNGAVATSGSITCSPPLIVGLTLLVQPAIAAVAG